MKDEHQWLQCARYIELNSVHAGLCEDPKEYRWTSYRYYAFGQPDSFITTKLHLSGMSAWSRNKENTIYKAFVLGGIDLDYQKLKREFEREQFKRT